MSAGQLRTLTLGLLDGMPPGPWDGEPDKAQWVDQATDLDCLIVRNRYGALCGYVGLPPCHPWHGFDYNDCDADVHGGLTYAGPCNESAGERGVCHVQEPGRPADVWWLGFDTAHCWDLTPQTVKEGNAELFGGTYRDFAYVQAECARLAAQLAEIRR